MSLHGLSCLTMMVATLALAICGCTTTTIAGREFIRDSGRPNTKDPAERGFLVVDKEKSICGDGGDHKLRAGFYVRPRQPRPGERESDYREYFEAERYRVAICAETAMWCNTNSTIWCRLDDEGCRDKNRGGGPPNLCFAIVGPTVDKPVIRPIVTQLNHDIVVSCASGSKVGYTSRLAWESGTTLAWTPDMKKWVAFCRQHRSAADCERLLVFRGTHTGGQKTVAAPYDYPRWAIEVLKTEKVDVHEDEGAIWAETELDVDPICTLLERRY